MHKISDAEKFMNNKHTDPEQQSVCVCVEGVCLPCVCGSVCT